MEEYGLPEKSIFFYEKFESFNMPPQKLLI